MTDKEKQIYALIVGIKCYIKNHQSTIEKANFYLDKCKQVLALLKQECSECGGSGKIICGNWPGIAKPCPKCQSKEPKDGWRLTRKEPESQEPTQPWEYERLKKKLEKIANIEIYDSEENDAYEIVGICKDTARDALALLNKEPCKTCMCMDCGKTIKVTEQSSHLKECPMKKFECQSQEPADHIPEYKEKVKSVSEFVKGVRFELVYREIAKVNNLFDKEVLKLCDRLEAETKRAEQVRGIAFKWQQIAQERRERADKAEEAKEMYHNAYGIKKASGEIKAEEIKQLQARLEAAEEGIDTQNEIRQSLIASNKLINDANDKCIKQLQANLEAVEAEFKTYVSITSKNAKDITCFIERLQAEITEKNNSIGTCVGIIRASAQVNTKRLADMLEQALKHEDKA